MNNKILKYLVFFFNLFLIACTTSPTIKNPKIDNSIYKPSTFKIFNPFIPTKHSRVKSVSFSSDGQFIASGGWEGSIKLWDANSGALIKTFDAHESSITGGANSVVFSPDISTLISGGEDGNIKIFDIQTEKITLIKAYSDSTKLVKISPNGKYLLSVGRERGKKFSIFNEKKYFDRDSTNILKIWDIKRRKELYSYSNVIQSSVNFTSIGNVIFFNEKDNVLIFDILKKQEIILFINKHKKEFDRSPYNTIFSSNNKYILEGLRYKEVIVSEFKTGKEVVKIKAGSGRIATVFFPTNSTSIFSLIIGRGNGEKNILRLDDLITGKGTKKFYIDGFITDISFSPNGRKFVSGDDDGNMSLWDIATNKKILDFGGGSQKNGTSSSALSKNGQYVILGGFNTLRLFDNSKSKFIWKKIDTGGWVNHVIFTPDGKYIASTNSSNVIKFSDVMTGKVVKVFKGHSSKISGIVFSPNEDVFASSSYNGELKLWNINDGNEIKSFKGGAQEIYSLAFSPSGKYIAAGHDGGGDFTGKWMNTQTIWNVENEKVINSFSGHYAGVGSIVFSPDEKYILSGSRDGTIKLWGIHDIKSTKAFVGDTGSVTKLAFNKNKNIIFFGGQNGSIVALDIEKGIKTKRFKGGFSSIVSLDFSQEGKLMFAQNSEGLIRYWNTKTGKELLTMVNFKDGEWVAITPDGYFDASKNGAKYLNIQTGSLKVSTIDQYYETFYRPDIIKLALQGKEKKLLVKIADIKSAPLVEIINTERSTDNKEITIRVKMTEQGGGLGQVRLYLNEVAVSLDGTRGLSRIKDKQVFREYTIKLAQGGNRIRAIAFNKENTMQSKDALYTVQATFHSRHKPVIHALIIGIDEFKNPKLRLNYSVADAKLFKQTLEINTRGLFDQLHVTLLATPEETTKARIISELEKMQALNPEDLFVFYAASHGTVDDGEYFFITSDVGSTSNRKLKKNALSQTEVQDLIANIPATKKFITLDTCNAGALGDAIQVALLTRGMSEDTAMKVLSRAVGSTVLSASSSQQEALEGYKEHGLFTWVLVEGLKGKADANNDGFVKTTEIADYLDDEVPKIAERIFNAAQYPTISPSGNAFPVTRH